MTQRQLWLNALNHSYSGRFPTDTWLRPEPEKALIEHFGVATIGEVMDKLGICRMHDFSCSWSNPEWNSRKDLKVLTGDSPSAGGLYFFHDDRTFENEWAVVRRVGRDGKYDEWITGPLADAEDPDPDIIRVPSPDHLKTPTEMAARIGELKEKGEFTFAGVTNPFKTAWFLRGLENFLVDYHLRPDFVRALFDRIVDREIPLMEAAVSAGVDLIKIGGDFAMQDRLIVGEDKWRELDKPAFKRMMDACRRINPEIRFFVHSDGNIAPVMDDLVDDLGFDMINPCQPEGMDLKRIKERYGDRIVMYGCGSLQRTLPFGSVEDVVAEVRQIIDDYGAGGGLVIAPANVMGFDIPLENIIAFHETGRDYFPY
jgi:uroporphyrinogen decarboxylase